MLTQCTPFRLMLAAVQPSSRLQICASLDMRFQPPCAQAVFFVFNPSEAPDWVLFYF